MSSRLKLLLVGTVSTCLLTPTQSALPHDLNGLLVTRSLPKDVRGEIEAREKIRNTPRKELLDPNLPREKRASVVESMGLPTKFESLEAVISARALWPQRTKLKICFYDGNASVQDEVVNIAQEIVNETNLALERSPYPCQQESVNIRVSFRQVGYWSYLGTDALLIDKAQPTMGLQNLDLQALDEQKKGIVRHEVMHAVGALHEHQHPGADCEKQLDWDRVAVSLGWSGQQMNNNFKQLLFDKNVVVGPYDKASIMHYQLPAYFWKSGTRSSCYLRFSNTQLSQGDLKMLNETYPK